jgi:hypothetical protein
LRFSPSLSALGTPALWRNLRSPPGLDPAPGPPLLYALLPGASGSPTFGTEIRCLRFHSSNTPDLNEADSF